MAGKKIILFLFIISILSGFFWNQKIFGQPITSDQLLYDGVALDILNNSRFTYEDKETFIEPIYPLFLAQIYAIFGHNYNIVRVIQIILFAITVTFVYLLGKELFNEKIAVASSLATALFYGIANQAGNIMTESVFILEIVLFSYFICRASLERRTVWFILAGLFLGLAVLTRGIVQFLPLLIGANIFIVFWKRESLKVAILKSGIFFLFFFIILMPWLVYNQQDTHGVVPRGGDLLSARAETMEKLYPDYPQHLIGHLFGYYFAQKINPQLDDSAFRDTPQTDQRIKDLANAGKSYSEINLILTEEAQKTIKHNFHKYILTSTLDFISFNSPIILGGEFWRNELIIHPMFADGRHPEISPALKFFIILSIRLVWFLFLFLVIYGLAKNIKNWQKFGWLFLVIFYFNFTYSAVHAIPRYALPIYPIYIILAFVGLNYFRAKISYVKNKVND